MKEGKKSGFGIIGLGRFGMALTKTLAEADAEVMVIDEDESKLRRVRNYVQDAFKLGKLTKEALEDTGIGECETVVVCIGERVDVSLLTTLNVINLGVPRVIAKADSIEHGIILERIGAEVVHPEMETATRLAAVLLESAALDMMNLNDDYVVSEIKVNNWLNGKSVRDLHLEKYALKMIALERGSSSTIVNFSQEDIVAGGDAIAVIGKFSDVDRFERKVMNRE
ncbi:potassium channel family protein [Zhenpiania hominis]|uniref:TrkA family potassium uptake protein n=1 Tax=Zhenpiania hominis TaxID=2763644 RepID=A0A923NN24_9FIRM|nr:TrkA family potassium uptake protein [Zhenpiania hominis]MBC6680162.1 TrkA family potassium uptake protein [Zhenpiania hominis]